jgi:hypothetical protein
MLPRRLAAPDAGFERPEKIEEGRGLLVEILVKTSDARRRLLGLRQVTLGNTTLHSARPFSTVRAEQLW